MNLPFDPEVWNANAALTCAQMRKAEELYVKAGGPSYDLMCRAGEETAKIIRKKFKPCRVLVLCGPGNNGGDGFIVAECLRIAKWDVTVAAMLTTGEYQNDAAKAAKAWRGKTTTFDSVSFDDVDLVVDAVFGTGLARSIEGIARDVLKKLSETKIPVVAVDLPSGIDGDTGNILGIASQAALTVTFFRKKYGHLLMPGLAQCGETFVADIGIDAETLSQINPSVAENNPSLWRSNYPAPKAGGHKYDRGNALIYGGAVMTGAARLGARAAQRMGTGLVTLAAPESAVPIYSKTLESVIVQRTDTEDQWKTLLEDQKRNAVLIGPGLGKGELQKKLVIAALKTGKPIVLDADALSTFADDPLALIGQFHAKCVLTPHEGEFTKIYGKQIDPALDKLTRTRQAAKISGCTVLLKGSDTIIADKDSFAVINANAPPWLATAGAGDVLAGMILGLIAQNMHPFQATAAAAWLHGRLAANFGPGLIAEDLVDGIPALLKTLYSGSEISKIAI